MKLLKKLLALLLVALIVVGCAKDTPTPTDPNNGEKPDPTTPTKDTLVVGTAGELNGDYINGFGNSSYDLWIKNLLHDYGTVATDEGGQFLLNKTVLDGDPVTVENADGSKTYTFKIKSGLKYNTGEEINAKDFVFDALFSASAEWLKTGASTSAYDQLVGYKAYHAGETKVFEGVKLVDDNTFSLTIAAENLPYFYEMAAVSAGPSPMFRYAPGLAIGDDGSSLKLAEGTELTDAQKADVKKNMEKEIANAQLAADDLKKEWDDAKANTEEPLSEEDDAKYATDYKKLTDRVDALKADLAAFEAGDNKDVVSTLLYSGALDVKNVYRYAPDVTTGAYQFVQFENQSVLVELNPNYVGNFQGKKPTIKRVEVRNVNEDLDVDLVIQGETDLVAGVIEGAKIEKAKANSDKVTLVDYKRNGYGQLSFHVDMEPVKYKEVRQAVAFLMDRNQFVENVLGGYGVVGQGEYGLSQWTYVAKGEEFLAKITERGTAYVLNVDKANELLDATPYKFEKDGKTPWDKEKAKELAASQGDNFNYWRYNAAGKELFINQGAGSQAVGDVVASQLTPNGRLAGMHYVVSMIDFNTLLTNYYNQEKKGPEQRTYHAYTLATGFTPVYDPYYSYHSDNLGTTDNTNQVNDPVADKITSEMRRFDSSNPEGFVEKWLEHQLWFNDFLPNIPLYSNQYFDIHNNAIEGLQSTPDWDWSQDIADLKIVG